jgi:hypothetical protein
MRRTLQAFPLLLALAGCGHPDQAFGPGMQSALPPALVPAVAPAKPSEAVSLHPADETARKPFIVIRFGPRAPDYGDALYTALEGALAQKPDASFDLVAVTRDSDAAERNLTRVFHSIRDMGMPAERLSLAAESAADDATDEVWIYVR